MNKILILASMALALSGCSDFFYGRTVEGQVTSQPNSRFKAGSEGGGTEKISIKLDTNGFTKDTKVQDVAGGPSGVILECLSTRCAQIQPGECHRFECKYQHNWNEPDVIACKHAKEIECPNKTGK